MVRRVELELLERYIVGNNGSHTSEPTFDSDGSVEKERFARPTALGRTLSGSLRVRMLGLMAIAAAKGRGCCDLPGLGVPASFENAADLGICVCEFEEIFGMGQSKGSYHVREIKGADLVREERRGK